MSTPVGPYSPAVRAGPWLVCSGQIGVEQGADGPVLVGGWVRGPGAQGPRQRVGAAVGARGSGWAHVVKTTVFLTDMADYAAFNAIYIEVLGEHRPARSVVAVAGLPLGALVEIEAWAYGGDASSHRLTRRRRPVTAPRCRGRSGSRPSAPSRSGGRAPRPAWPAGAGRGRRRCGPRRSTRSPTPGDSSVSRVNTLPGWVARKLSSSYSM